MSQDNTKNILKQLILIMSNAIFQINKMYFSLCHKITQENLMKMSDDFQHFSMKVFLRLRE